MESPVSPISKKQLRKVLLAYRQLIDKKCFDARNKKLANILMEVVRKENAKIIHTFLPIERNREPDTRSLFSDLRKNGCRIVVSKTNFESRTLEHFYLEEGTVLEKNRLGIPEPSGATPARIEDVQLILVPLAAADKSGNRIGYGGGFYDRLLANTKALKIGLCLSPLLDEIVQTEEWDVKTDEILTPFH